MSISTKTDSVLFSDLFPFRSCTKNANYWQLRVLRENSNDLMTNRQKVPGGFFVRRDIDFKEDPPILPLKSDLNWPYKDIISVFSLLKMFN